MCSTTILRAATVLLMAVLVTAALGADIIEQILVKVNGEIFTKTDLESKQVAALRQKGQQIDLKSDPKNQQLRQALNEITPQIMVDVVDEMLIVQRGKELGYRLSDEQFQSIIDGIKKENKIESEEQFQAALKQENMTPADLRRNLEKTVIVQRVEQNEVISKVGVSEEEARAYYESHMTEFTTAPSIMLREILVTVPSDPKGVNVAADEQAQDRAAKIRARAASGENFEKLAAEVSDAPSKTTGGLLAPIGLNDLSPDLRKVIEPMKAGQVTEAIRTSRGYQILKLESSTSAQTMPFDQAREQISERVVTGKRKQELQKYLVKLRSQAIIEWKNDDVKRAYEEGLKQQASAMTSSL